MATDVDVQYFSHLNGLMLGNNWGDLIRLLDTCLVNGLPLTSITSASIDEQGDIHLTTYAAHNSMLFQIIELGGFAPAELNGKYRIKGVPTANELILKAEHLGKAITTIGAAKLASLGYEIIFRDTGDVKRVYRAKNPTAQHPFIRVDETISDGVNSYNSAYAKYAMVGLLEHIDRIDDYENLDVLQLPFDPVDPTKNWKITGTGTSVVRGWSRWYWCADRMMSGYTSADTKAPASGAKAFCIFGDSNAFYLSVATHTDSRDRLMYGCGLYESALPVSIIPNWFLASTLALVSAETNYTYIDYPGSSPFVVGFGNNVNKFISPTILELQKISNHTLVTGVVPDTLSGCSGLYPNNTVSALEVPITGDGYLRGTLKHLCYAGKIITEEGIVLSDNSVYLYLPVGIRSIDNQYGGYYAYLGELE